MGPRGMNHEKTLLAHVICPWHSVIFLPLLTETSSSAAGSHEVRDGVGSEEASGTFSLFPPRQCSTSL